MRARWGVSLALLVGCRADPFGPVGASARFAPPPIYRVWHAEVEACAGRASNFNAITWWVADSLGSPPGVSETFGTWTPPHTIRLRREYLMEEWVVKHEMLHDLLQTTDHPIPLFEVCDWAP